MNGLARYLGVDHQLDVHWTRGLKKQKTRTDLGQVATMMGKCWTRSPGRNGSFRPDPNGRIRTPTRGQCAVLCCRANAPLLYLPLPQAGPEPQVLELGWRRWTVSAGRLQNKLSTKKQLPPVKRKHPVTQLVPCYGTP